MKKILIVNNNMQIGGIQKALANLLSEIAPNYEITLFLLAPEGALMKEIPETVRVIAANRFLRVLGLTHAQAKNEGRLMMIWLRTAGCFDKDFENKNGVPHAKPYGENSRRL